MIEVTVSLQTKKGMYYAVLYYKDTIKGYQYKWKSTKVKYIDESQKRLHKKAEQEAIAKAEELRKGFEEEINSKVEDKKLSTLDDRGSQKFTDYMLSWAEKQKGKKDVTTSGGYESIVNGIIIPFFEDSNITLEELQPIHLQEFYDFQYNRVLTKGVNKGKFVSKNTVHHYHTTIHKALNDAVDLGLIEFNPDDRTNIERPDKHIATYYAEDECFELLEKVKGNKLELLINIATYYGLRRSEILGLRWSAIDFTNSKITIKHKVTQATIDNKRVLVQEDKMKNDSSYRSLPLIEEVKELLLIEKGRQARNKELYGNTYKNSNEYIFVEDDGELTKPDTVSRRFSDFVEKNNLNKICLKNLRHSCASLLLLKGISMKEIQLWLGHSSYSTTANIYTHVDITSKKNIANTISNVFQTKKVA